jgi:hypothetical protein
MADRARRAEARAQRRQEAAEAVVAGQENENEEDLDDNEEMEDVPVRVHHRRARGPAVVPQLALDPGMWMNMVNVKPPYLPDLEIESMKKFILEYKRYSQKCPRQLLRNMQQFILEDHMEMIVSESEQEYEEIILLSKTFYTSGGYEIQTEQGFIVIPPEIVKKSILCLSIIDYDNTTH